MTMPRAILKKVKGELATAYSGARLQPLHRRMSFTDFERMPRQPGWKHEYYAGKAHITPCHTMVSFLLDLTRRKSVDHPGIRTVTEADADALLQPFLDAFRETPEYAGYPAKVFKKSAVKYIAGFFGNARGQRSHQSLVIENKGRIIAAALVKRGQTLPLLDCLFVCPAHSRKGLATLMVNRVVNGLLEQNETKLLSYALLANDASLAWHHHFGFQEVPDLWVASSRWHAYAHQLNMHRQTEDLADSELAELAERTAFWRAEVDRLTELEKRDFWAAHPQFD
jgi:N-acetylglutamate synthase-like GNAT family acetyltransferase